MVVAAARAGAAGKNSRFVGAAGTLEGRPTGRNQTAVAGLACWRSRSAETKTGRRRAERTQFAAVGIGPR